MPQNKEKTQLELKMDALERAKRAVVRADERYSDATEDYKSYDESLKGASAKQKKEYRKDMDRAEKILDKSKVKYVKAEAEAIVQWAVDKGLDPEKEDYDKMREGFAKDNGIDLLDIDDRNHETVQERTHKEPAEKEQGRETAKGDAKNTAEKDTLKQNKVDIGEEEEKSKIPDAKVKDTKAADKLKDEITPELRASAEKEADRLAKDIGINRDNIYISYQDKASAIEYNNGVIRENLEWVYNDRPDEFIYASGEGREDAWKALTDRIKTYDDLTFENVEGTDSRQPGKNLEKVLNDERKEDRTEFEAEQMSTEELEQKIEENRARQEALMKRNDEIAEESRSLNMDTDYMKIAELDNEQMRNGTEIQQIAAETKVLERTLDEKSADKEEMTPEKKQSKLKRDKQEIKDLKAEISKLQEKIGHETAIMVINGGSIEDKDKIDAMAKEIGDKTIELHAKQKGYSDEIKKRIKRAPSHAVKAAGRQFQKLGQSMVRAGKEALAKVQDKVHTANEEFKTQGRSAYADITHDVTQIYRDWKHANYALKKTQARVLGSLEKSLSKHYMKSAERSAARQNIKSSIKTLFTGKKQDLVQSQGITDRQAQRLARIEMMQQEIDKEAEGYFAGYQKSAEKDLGRMTSVKAERENLGMKKYQNLEYDIAQITKQMHKDAEKRTPEKRKAEKTKTEKKQDKDEMSRDER